ncbi:uncharacterized protein LOC142328980 isoform X2 [Lycorma delicatula]
MDPKIGNSLVGLLAGALVLVTRINEGVCQCSKQEYQQCVIMADPLLKDPHLIYPDNPQDIDRVCRTWTEFVNCVKQYTERCFSDIRKQEFNKAVEVPIDSVHQLCTDPQYQKEYLKHSSCMKSTLTDDSHCGRHYRYLVSQVSGEASRSAICCAHHRFRECVLDQTHTSCAPDAKPFSRQILDKALSFLRDQCSTYIPTKEECPGSEFYDATGRTESGAPDISSHSHPGTRFPTTGQTTPDYSWPPSTTGSIPGPTSRIPDWSTSWIPGRGRTTEMPTSETYPDSSTRSSFGRGMTWSQTPETTTPTWRATQQPWYPTHPEINVNNVNEQMMKENTIDEPNQQGLGSKEGGNAANSILPYMFSTILTVLIINIFAT